MNVMKQDNKQYGVVYVVDSTYSSLLFASVSSLISCGVIDGKYEILIYHFGIEDSWQEKINFLGKNIEFIDANTILEKSGVVFNDKLGADSRHRITRALIFSKVSPFEITLYVDSDSLFFDDISPIFELFEKSRCELAMATEPYNDPLEPLYFFFGWPESLDRAKAYDDVSRILGLNYPDDMPGNYYNAGILCGRKGKWAEVWVKLLVKVTQNPNINPCDSQLLLLGALSLTKAEVFPLDPSWNFSYRTKVDRNGACWEMHSDGDKYLLVSGQQSQKLRIFHAIGGIHWMPAFINFPEGILYLKEVLRFISNK
jgi:lipopolysaccharide biosynthesis glycosyltransferase